MKNIDKFGKWVKQLSTLILSIPNMSASTYKSVFRQFLNDPIVMKKLPRGTFTPGWPNVWRGWIRRYLSALTSTESITTIINSTRNIYEDEYDAIINMMVNDFKAKSKIALAASKSGKYIISFTLTVSYTHLTLPTKRIV